MAGHHDGRDPRFVRELFAGIARDYDRGAFLLSLGQMRRWHRQLVRSVGGVRAGLVLDVCTGTGAVARRILRSNNCSAVGIDISREMLLGARNILDSDTRRRALEEPATPAVTYVMGTAGALPFSDCTFDAVTFTFLMRYVDRPELALAEMVRVLKPGGVLASLEFGVPQNRLWRAGWAVYAVRVLPLAGRALGPGWAAAGEFLGPNILDYVHRYPIDKQVLMWEKAGIGDISWSTPTFGAAVIIRGTKN